MFNGCRYLILPQQFFGAFFFQSNDLEKGLVDGSEIFYFGT